MSIETHDWDRTLRIGAEMAVDAARAGADVKPEDVMWALLCEAVQVSRAFPAPPRLGYPAKSSLPDAPPDISVWARIMAYLQGEIEEMPDDVRVTVQPTATQIERAEAVLHLWHHYAIPNRGNRKRMRQAIYAQANGAPYRKIRAMTGIGRTALYNARMDAMADMWCAMKKIAK